MSDSVWDDFASKPKVKNREYASYKAALKSNLLAAATALENGKNVDSPVASVAGDNVTISVKIGQYLVPINGIKHTVRKKKEAIPLLKKMAANLDAIDEQLREAFNKKREHKKKEE